jgi:hypothetical protein
MVGVVTYLRRLKNGCLDALSSRFTRWTKPLRTSLPLATFTVVGQDAFERRPLVCISLAL